MEEERLLLKRRHSSLELLQKEKKGYKDESGSSQESYKEMPLKKKAPITLDNSSLPSPPSSPLLFPDLSPPFPLISTTESLLDPNQTLKTPTTCKLSITTTGKGVSSTGVSGVGTNIGSTTSKDQYTTISSTGASITCRKDTKSDSIVSNDEKESQLVFNMSTVTNFVRPSQDLNVVYYPCFISSRDSTLILKTLKDQLEPYFARSPNIIKLGGRQIPIPRRQTAFGDSGLKYSFSGVSVPSNPWIPSIKRLKNCVEKASGEKFNFVLVNSYADGSKYIGEHRDDERELRPCSCIASLTFGAQRDFVFRHASSRGKSASRKDIAPVKISLLNGSLLLMKHPTNKMWYHSLPVRKGVASLRINLTFRQMITPSGMIK